MIIVMITVMIAIMMVGGSMIMIRSLAFNVYASRLRILGISKI